MIVKKIVSIIIILSITITSLLYNCTHKTIASERITIEPTISDETGVDVNSEFIISTPEQRDFEEIKNGLSITPEVKFKVTKKSKGKCVIKLQEELERNSVYVFNLNLEGFDTSWAFQTQKEFDVIGTLPRDESQQVPINSGIEIIFTHKSVTNIDKYFEITPKAKGKFEYHKNTVVFVPDELDEQTIYTVKIKKGLKLGSSNQVLKNDIEFKFETDMKKKENKEYIEFSGDLLEFSTEENPVINVIYYDNSRRSSEDKIDKNVDINVYKYKGYEDFIDVMQNDNKPYWSLYNRMNFRYDTKDLELVQSFNIDLEGDNRNSYLMFPETLEEGYYLIHGTKGENVFQTHIQVTNISAFYTESNTKTLFWIHNLDTDKPLVDANIQIDEKTYTSDENGLVIYDTNSENSDISNVKNEIKYIRISKGEMTPLVLRIYPKYSIMDRHFYPPNNNDYLSYIFLDRGMYKPGDTVNFWGVVKSLKNEDVNNLSVELTRNYWSSPDSYLLKREIVLLEDGTFDGYFKLQNLKEGYYSLTIKTDNKKITTTGFRVERYTKPAYKIEIDSDKKAIFDNEEINFDIKASFFEGTPVSNLKFRYQFDGLRKESETDINGEATLTYKQENKVYSNNSFLEYKTLYVSALLPEMGDISASKSFYVYMRDRMITADSKVENKKGIVSININDIDLTSLNSSNNENIYHNNQSVIGNPSQNKKLTATLMKHEWKKIEKGVEYDFVNKVTVKKYEYITNKIFIEKKELVTDANGQAEYEFDIEENTNYTVKINSEDSKGREIATDVYVSEIIPYWQYDRVELKPNKEEYKFGEEVKLDFVKGDDTIKHSGDILYILAQNGIQDYNLYDGAQYKFVYDEKYLPNIYAHGVAFNGKTYVYASSSPIKMNTLEKKLNIDIKSDKESYKPGEEVTLTIKTFDKNNNPIKSSVNLSIVDEAFFSLQNQNVDTLKQLYKLISDGINNTYISHNTNQSGYPGVVRFGMGLKSDGHIQFSEASMDSSKNGSNGETRSIFKDTALFKTVRTNENGEGEITFKLPHNITDWRITYQGVSKDLNAGSGYININATLPFFTDVVLNDTYLEGDKPIIALNSFGIDLEEGEAVKYEISAPSLGINEFVEIQGTSFEQAYFELPILSLGEHKILIKAESDKGYIDSLEKRFEVLETYHTRIVNDYYELDNSLKIKGSKDGITTLIFSDLNRGKYYYDLAYLKYDSGVRVDQKLTSYIAKKLLEEYFDEKDEKKADLDFYKYQLDDGGISILPYGESDIELTAKIADIDSNSFDEALLGMYFSKMLEESNNNKAIVLYGMAALNQPVLLELNELSKIDNLTIKDRLYIALAYEKNGHKEAAVKILQKILLDSAEINDTYIRIDKGVDQDDILEITSLAALLAARTEMSEKDRLFAYVKNHQTKDILLKLEKLMFLKEELVKLPDIKAAFKYRLNNDEKDIVLENGRVYRLSIAPENLEDISFEQIEGRTAINVIYEESMNTLSENIDKYASVRREYYTIDGKKTNVFSSTDIVKVVIYPNIEGKAFNGVYEVVDVLPSGLKPIENFWGRVPYNTHERYPWSIEGQKVKFYTYSNSKNKNEPMVYYARVISKGKFNCERVIIQNSNTRDTANFSEKDNIVIE